MEYAESVKDWMTGIWEMDDLHRDMLQTLQQLRCAGDQALVMGYPRLVACMESAFQQEELWMEELEDSALSLHREQHARVLGALHQVHSRLMAGDVEIVRHVVADLLPQWISLHVATMDITLALSMQVANHGCGPGNEIATVPRIRDAATLYF